jgi:hypothetical protein
MARIEVWTQGIQAPLDVRHVRVRAALSALVEVSVVVCSPALGGATCSFSRPVIHGLHRAIVQGPGDQ